MFTVKLMSAHKHDDFQRFSTKLVEAEVVNIHILRPGKLVELCVFRGDRNEAFYIADTRTDGRPDGFADEIDFYYAAFVENTAGKTTEVVRL